MAITDNPPFRLLAKFYDEVLPGISEMNRHARAKMLDGKLDGARTVCDLACGSGSTALDLARAGKRVFAVDNSAEFCRVVRSRAKDEKLPIKVLRADMRDFALPEQVDLLTCEFAALNNLADHADSPKVFAAVYRALRPGGWFAFDVNTLTAQIEQSHGTHWIESPRFRLVMRCSTDPDGRRTTLGCEWFVPVKRLWRHVRESYVNIAWSEREIRRALKGAGFERPIIRDGVDVRPPGFAVKRGYDIYYLVRKPLKKSA